VANLFFAQSERHLFLNIEFLFHAKILVYGNIAVYRNIAQSV